MSTRALLVLILLAALAVGGAWLFANRKRTGTQQVAATTPLPATSLAPNQNTLPAGTVVSQSYATSHAGMYAKNPDGTLTVQTSAQANCSGFAGAGKPQCSITPKAPPVTNPAPITAQAPATPQGSVTIKPRAVGSTPPAAGTPCNKSVGGIGGIGSGKINASGVCV